jgi:hypothetical protein
VLYEEINNKIGHICLSPSLKSFKNSEAWQGKGDERGKGGCKLFTPIFFFSFFLFLVEVEVVREERYREGTDDERSRCRYSKKV